MSVFSKLRIVFMGTPDFAVPSLRALHKAGHEIIAVCTRASAPAKRGKHPQASAIQREAEALNLVVRTPTSLKGTKITPEITRDLQAADIAIVAAYGHIIPASLLSLPKYGCWNIHASLLPRWRGAAPINRAIMAGDTKTGITIMQMDKGLDTGAILATKEWGIDDTTTAATLHNDLARLGAEAIVKTLAALNTLTPQPQPEIGITYAEKIDKSETRIDWRNSADVVQRHIHGLSPSPGAWFLYNDMRVKVLSAETTTSIKGVKVGTIIESPLTIACEKGGLRLLQVQRAGKAAMSATDFIRGISEANRCAIVC